MAGDDLILPYSRQFRDGYDRPAGCYTMADSGESFFNEVADASLTTPQHNSRGICTSGIILHHIFFLKFIRNIPNIYIYIYTAEVPMVVFIFSI